MTTLRSLIARKERLRLMLDLLNELASGSPNDQSQLKIDLVEELERLRGEMAEIESNIDAERRL
ncbi:MAG: hypothetical protein WBJ10_08575 [Daejeonella sp.]|uniref:hypothetical protein n=1 Tax=Daejeonella sp. TaxID=2805397 RepID=UPI003C761B74